MIVTSSSYLLATKNIVFWTIVFYYYYHCEMISFVWSLPNGAPQRSCRSLSPQHFAQSQPPQTCPFVVRALLVKRGSRPPVIHVSINPRVTNTNQHHYLQGFRGFSVQARLASNPSVLVDGQFHINNVDSILSHTFGCDSDSVRVNNCIEVIEINNFLFKYLLEYLDT